MEAEQVKAAPEKVPLNVTVTRLTRQQNEVMLQLFRTAYCIAKQNFSIRSFPVLVSLQECNGLKLGAAYQNRMAASSFISSIAKVEQKSIVDEINKQEVFSVLIDGA